MTIPDSVLMPDGRRFELIGEEPYVRKSDGQSSRLLIWRGNCRKCGAAYAVKSPASLSNTHSFGVVHCAEHRQRCAAVCLTGDHPQ